MSFQLTTRHIGDVVVLDVVGRVTVGEDSTAIRDEVRTLVAGGQKKILLNLALVSYIDSSGLGQIVAGHSTALNQGGHLKLVNLSKRVKDLLHMTRLFIALEVYDDEAAAIAAFP